MVALTRGREKRETLASEADAAKVEAVQEKVEAAQQRGEEQSTSDVGSDEEDDVSVGSDEESSDEESASSDASTSDASSDDSDESDEELDALFAKTLAAMKKRDEAAVKPTIGQQGAFDENNDVIALESEEDTSKASKPKESKTKGKRAWQERKSRNADKERELESAFERLKNGGDLGDAKPKPLRQQQRERREQRAQTAGPGWFDMPAFPGSTTSSKTSTAKSLTNPNGKYGDARGPTAEDMRREIQAIRLRNAIDPKRFYRGGAANDKEMPKFAQLGRIISSHAQPAATMNRGERGRTVIDELVKDAETAAYAKRKFGEHQDKSNVGWSSHVRRHQKGGRGKRQRR